jgi:polyisoprenoid-binding protein YceI
MKKTILTFALAFCTTLLFAQDWTLDKGHASVGFIVPYMGVSELAGNFGKFDAKISSSKDDFSDAVIEFTAEVASISTGHVSRDNHLKSDDYFGAEKFPTVTFKSTSVKKTSGDNYKISGELTMRGVTKSITLDAVIKGPVEARDKKAIGVTVTGIVKRVEHGVGPAGPRIGEEIHLRVSGPFMK